MPANSKFRRESDWPTTRRRLFAAVVFALVTLMPACAARAPVPLPAPEEIPQLESVLVDDPTNVPTLVRLGVAYQEAGRLSEARVTLESAVAIDPNDPAGVFYLGLIYEQQDLPTDARRLYERYIEVGSRNDVKEILARRMPALERRELLLDVRYAIAREAEIANTPPQPRTVAIFPFFYRGAHSEYEPLGRALAEMLVTDLSQTDRLTVLERSRIQLLVDEMNLGQSGLVDSLTTARSGRLLGAERIVQGQIDVDDTLLRLQAAVVGTRTGSLDGPPLVEQDALQQLFEMQKRLALNLFGSLGIELTAAERQRVTRIPTENIQALLAYGRCLEAEDAGQYADAAVSCAEATALDPGFAEARQKSQVMNDAAVALQLTLPQVASLASPEIVASRLAANPAEAFQLQGLDAIQALLPDEVPRAAVQEALGPDGGRTTTIDIIIRRP